MHRRRNKNKRTRRHHYNEIFKTTHYEDESGGLVLYRGFSTQARPASRSLLAWEQ
jgi:hypothetical protein